MAAKDKATAQDKVLAPDQAVDEPTSVEDRLSPGFLHPEEVKGDDHSVADAARAAANKAARSSREAEQEQIAKYDREAERAQDADPQDFLTQEDYRKATTNRAPFRDEAAHAAAVGNELAILGGAGPHLDQAPVREEDTVHLDPLDDDRIPVNELAMRLGQTPNGTETCWACGHEKPKPVRPGRDLPEEYCPFCGKGSQAEPI